ncbi:30S ribosomal protein S5 [Candidatus Cyanaurora vandensis]|uniref:30S ribosomal protein S5 n=1 Tax=Candidatus Cyanaurora vandensis TaxID=2714958 RepID=UPI002579847A|nr:30S ribosomal protein S5 [Candidatus Cyanaurora vandensis]
MADFNRDSNRDSNKDSKERGGGGDRKRKQRDRTAEQQPESEWKERVVQIRRVTKVVKGGKKLSFRAVVVLGNEKGQVGVGVGKAAEVIGAVKKGVTEAKKCLVTVPLTRLNSIPHPMTGTAGAAKVMLRPAAAGTGVIAGGAVRTVLELAGVKNILAKSLGADSPLNNARAATDALSQLRNFKDIADERGIPVSNLYSK